MDNNIFVKNKLPKVAIIGRPNVGKSTLFNRLVRFKSSIVFPTPGITRDRLDKVINYDDFKFVLIDTGGITIEDEDDFKAHIRKHGEVAFNEADVIIFLVDIDGITSDDIYIAEKLRKINKPILLVVNKIDNEKRLKFVSEFFELGFGDPIPISAEHGRNIYDLIEEIKNKMLDKYDNNILQIDKEEETEINSIKVSIIGKPNSGKSSLLNKILGYERSIVTDVPGTTRDSIEESMIYQGKKMVFIDTAGIRRKAKIPGKNIEYISVKRAINSVKRSDVVLLLIDSTENITQQDKKIASIAVSNGKALILVINKWDLAIKDNLDIEKYKEWIKFRFAVASHVPIINISAITGMKIKKLLKLITVIHNEYSKRIETSNINIWISKVTDSYSPSSKKGVLKIYYGTQVSAAPPKFIFFINNSKLITDSYERYLINNLREAFGFSGVPLILRFKNHK